MEYKKWNCSTVPRCEFYPQINSKGGQNPGQGNGSTAAITADYGDGLQRLI